MCQSKSQQTFDQWWDELGENLADGGIYAALPEPCADCPLAVAWKNHTRTVARLAYVEGELASMRKVDYMLDNPLESVPCT